MKYMLKKLLIIASAVILINCGTLQGLLDTVSGGSDSESRNPSNTGGSGLVSRLSKNYTLPASYEAADNISLNLQKRPFFSVFRMPGNTA
jgi:hypothetical protein